MAGLTKWVRPPLPCRPSKLRLEVAAQRCPGERMSGFMPRHMEQPATRPIQAGLGEDTVETFLFSFLLNFGGAGNYHCVDIGVDLAALDDLGGGAEVFEAGVGACADEDTVNLYVLNGSARGQIHVLKGAGCGFLLGSFFKGSRVRHPAADRGHHAGVRAPGNVGFNGGGIEDFRLVEGSARVGGQLLPALHRGVEVCALGGELAAAGRTRRWSRRGQSCQRGRRPRCSCCRRSCVRPWRGSGWLRRCIR